MSYQPLTSTLERRIIPVALILMMGTPLIAPPTALAGCPVPPPVTLRAEVLSCRFHDPLKNPKFRAALDDHFERIQGSGLSKPEKEERRKQYIKSNTGIILEVRPLMMRFGQLGLSQEGEWQKPDSGDYKFSPQETYFKRTESSSDCNGFKPGSKQEFSYTQGCPMVPFDTPAGVVRQIIPAEKEGR